MIKSTNRWLPALFLVLLVAAAPLAAQARSQSPILPATTTLTFAPTADAYVAQSSQSSNFGTSTTLRAGTSPATRSYLRFVVNGLNGSVAQSARVRFYAQSSNSTGVALRSLSNNTWTESGITYKNAPAPGSVINSSSSITAGSWFEVDVSSYVRGDAAYNMVLTSGSSTNISVASREVVSFAPQLVITTMSTPTPTASPSATSVPPTATLPATSTATDMPAATATLTDLPPALPTQTTVVPVTVAPTDTATIAPIASATSLPPDTPTQTATDTPSPSWQPSFPIRAAFYYPWFPEAWTQSGIYPYTNYHPSLGFYSSSDAAVLSRHIAMMQYGGIQAGIASWWGQGSRTDSRVPALLSAAAGTNFRWSLYYENESMGDPTPAQIQNDLSYIRDHYATDPSYLRVNGRFVVFVYADGNDGCSMVDRWKQANTVGAFVVLKVFSGYLNCASQPDDWHQYAPAVAEDHQGSRSFSISPGFWLVGNSVRLVRDLTRWQQNVRDMVASGSRWQLVTTFSEWGEGTAVEPATEWSSASGYGLYLDALHNNGLLP